MASDIHAKLKQKDEALAVVTDGLRHVPDSTVLQRKYKERGGKLPYPEPVARAADVPEVQAHPAGEGKTLEGEGKHQDKVKPDPVSPQPDAAEEGSKQENAQAPAKPKIGSPTNPWCRFCPDPAQ